MSSTLLVCCPIFKRQHVYNFFPCDNLILHEATKYVIQIHILFYLIVTEISSGVSCNGYETISETSVLTLNILCYHLGTP